MSVAWYSIRMWDWCVPEDDKKKKQESCGIIKVLVSSVKNIMKYRKIKLFHK